MFPEFLLVQRPLNVSHYPYPPKNGDQKPFSVVMSCFKNTKLEKINGILRLFLGKKSINSKLLDITLLEPSRPNAPSCLSHFQHARVEYWLIIKEI